MGSQQVVQVEEKTNNKLGFFYSLGEVGSQLSWYMVNTYLTLFYTDIIGLTAASISFIMLVAGILDTINSPIMGIVADRTHTRWGKFRPYLIIAPPILAIFNILTFTVFEVQGTAKVILCLITYIGVGISYTATSVPYGGLVNLIAKDSQVRMNYTAARGIGSSVISMILSAVGMPMILFFSKSKVANASGYFWTAIVCSCIMVPCFWLCAWKCKETVKVEIPQGKAPKKSVIESLKLIYKNKMLLITVSCVFLGSMAIMGRMSKLAYYVIYVVGSYEMIAPMLTIMTVMQLIGCLFLPWGTKTFGKRNWLIILNVIQIIGFVFMYMAPLNSPGLLLGVSAIIGITNSSSNVCTGMLSDCIEYGDWKYGIREEGITYSYMSLGVKLATAITGSVSVILLGATGYVAGAEQTEATKNGINMIVNLIPAICIFISIIPLFFYKLNSKTVAKIREELDARNAAVTE